MCEDKSRTVKDHLVVAGPAVAAVQRAPPQQNQPARGAKQPPDSGMGFWWTSCLTVLLTAIIVAWIPNLLYPEPPKGNVEGSVTPKFKKVEEVFR